jgi:hypothetical protein
MSHRARLYQFAAPANSTERDAWARLLALASQRAGRVRLTKHLSGGAQTAQAERDTTRHTLGAAQRRVQASRRQLHPAGGSEPPLR